MLITELFKNLKARRSSTHGRTSGFVAIDIHVFGEGREELMPIIMRHQRNRHVLCLVEHVASQFIAIDLRTNGGDLEERTSQQRGRKWAQLHDACKYNGRYVIASCMEE